MGEMERVDCREAGFVWVHVQRSAQRIVCRACEISGSVEPIRALMEVSPSAVDMCDCRSAIRGDIL